MTDEPTGKAPSAAPASQRVGVVHIGDRGLSGRFDADPEERAGIAAALDLLALDNLLFSYRLDPAGDRRLRLTGTLTADCVQRCVVTLEPVRTSVSEAVDLLFWPERDVERLESGTSEEAMLIDLEGPEPYDGETIDVGLLAYELLASSLDPHPRQPGAIVEWTDNGPPDMGAPDSPFAVLKKLGGKRDQ